MTAPAQLGGDLPAEVEAIVGEELDAADLADGGITGRVAHAVARRVFALRPVAAGVDREALVNDLIGVLNHPSGASRIRVETVLDRHLAAPPAEVPAELVARVSAYADQIRRHDICLAESNGSGVAADLRALLAARAPFAPDASALAAAREEGRAEALARLEDAVRCNENFEAKALEELKKAHEQAREMTRREHENYGAAQTRTAFARQLLTAAKGPVKP